MENEEIEVYVIFNSIQKDIEDAASAIEHCTTMEREREKLASEHQTM